MLRFNDMTTQSVNYGADVRRRVINVDAAYRDDLSGTTTNFQYKLTTPVRNVHGFKVTSVEFSNISMGSYALLQVNDESSIEARTVSGGEIRAVAKILNRPRFSGDDKIVVGDTFGLVSNNVIFRNPQDIARLQVKVVNPNGTVCADASGVSFTLELQETVNSYLYESQRKHIGFNPANM